MKIGFFSKAKGLISKPTHTFRAVEGDTLGDAIKYAAIWYIILGALYGLFTALTLKVADTMFDIPDWMTNLGFLLIPIMAIAWGIFAIIGILILGAWQHLWVVICRGRKGYKQTVKACSYGGTPSYLLGWIPYIGGILGLIGALIVTTIGLRELHQISTGRAITACLLAIFPPFILVIALAAMLGSS